VTRRRCTVCRIPEGGCVCAKGPTFAEERAAPHPLDTPGIELRDAFGWAVFTASEGEDPSLHAWFAGRPSAEAYVRASEQAASWQVEQPLPPLAQVPNASFEPHITRCMGKFAASYADPESIPEAHFERALTKYTDDHEKREWMDLLEQALPYVQRGSCPTLLGERDRVHLIRMIKLTSGLLPDPPVHFVTYKQTLQGNFLITECGEDAGEFDGRFTNDQDAVTCAECLRALGMA
jgi:hypothetical protein